MTRLGKVLSPYLIASLATLIAGWMATFVLASGLKLPVDPWLAIALLWLLTAGLPSMLAATNHLMKRWGSKGAGARRMKPHFISRFLDCCSLLEFQRER